MMFSLPCAAEISLAYSKDFIVKQILTKILYSASNKILDEVVIHIDLKQWRVQICWIVKSKAFSCL